MGKQIEQGVMDKYRANWNRRSLDGLPGLRVARRDYGEYLFLGDVKAKLFKTLRASPGGNLLLLVLVAILSSLLTAVGLYLLGLTVVKPGTSGISLWGMEL